MQATALGFPGLNPPSCGHRGAPCSAQPQAPAPCRPRPLLCPCRPGPWMGSGCVAWGMRCPASGRASRGFSAGLPSYDSGVAGPPIGNSLCSLGARRRCGVGAWEKVWFGLLDSRRGCSWPGRSRVQPLGRQGLPPEFQRSRGHRMRRGKPGDWGRVVRGIQREPECRPGCEAPERGWQGALGPVLP